MNLAFVVYDGMTALDFVGAYDPLTRLGTMDFADVEWSVCARAAPVADGAGLGVVPDSVGEPLDGYDVVVVPGGRETRTLVDDARFLDWLADAGDAELLASVCTGSLLLGAAGLLDGREATTHPSAYDLLAEYCGVREERVVKDPGDADDPTLVTARGVSSSLDLGLYLCRKLADSDASAAIRERMDYPYGEFGRDGA